TSFSRDWSSDVCSSDLGAGVRVGGKVYVVPAVRIEHLPADTGTLWGLWLRAAYALRPNLSLEAGYRTLKVDLETGDSFDTGGLRSEERREGGERRVLWS